MNYPETIWCALRLGMFPKVHGEHERELKRAFLQGMHAGRTLVDQSLALPDQECVAFLSEFRQQIAGAMTEAGIRPGTVSLGRIGPDALPGPRVKMRINGEDVE